MSKIILDLCGGTGSWSEPYKKAGYDVRLITLPDFDVTRWREYPELIEPLTCEIEEEQVYGILAAPPCTEFSKAKADSYRDLRKAMIVVKSCLDIIWEARINGALKFWALENPVGFLRQFLGKPNFTFEPYWYGDLHSKRTDVWGYFNLPNKKYHELPPLIDLIEGDKSHNRSYSNPKAPAMYKHLKLDRAAIRAITPPEFAKAFFKANQ